MKKIFVSSVIKDFETFRQAAQTGIELLGHAPVMAEKFSSRTYSSEVACISEVQNSDLVVLVLGNKYGFKTSENISVTHSEYLAAKKSGKPILVFVQDCEMEDEQISFKKEIEVYDSGFFRTKFSSPEELKDLVVKSIRTWELEKTAVNTEAFMERVKSILLDKGSRNEGMGIVVFWPQPVQEIDLSEIEKNSDDLFTQICKTDAAILRKGYELISESKKVTLKSGTTELSYYSDGLISLSFNTEKEDNRGFSFDYCFVSPSKFSSIALKSQIFIKSKAILCLVGLCGMDNRYFDEPVAGNSLTMPMFKQPSELSAKLFNPYTEISYKEWIDLEVKKFKRIYSLVKR